MNSLGIKKLITERINNIKVLRHISGELNKNSFLNMICEAGKSVSDFILDLPAMYRKPGGYIEVQLWSDEYMKHLL
jgi:hypothetical protein